MRKGYELQTALHYTAASSLAGVYHACGEKANDEMTSRRDVCIFIINAEIPLDIDEEKVSRLSYASMLRKVQFPS